MTTVFLYGTDKETETTDVLLSSIRSLKASALLITSKAISMLPPDVSQVDYLILDNANIQTIHIDKGILIFKKEIGSDIEYEIPEEFVAITEPDNEKAIKILQKNSLQTVTCGLSQRDTLTFSSLDTGKAVISLQREIKDLAGKSVLPHEIPVVYQTKFRDYPLLAATAVLLLSGFVIPEEGLIL